METWQRREALILSGAPTSDLTYLQTFLEEHPNIYVICADGGLRYLPILNIQPDLLVGDFDTITPPDIDCEIIRLLPEKDDTDTMHALQVSLDRGYHRVWITCATGGRMDHTLANLSLCEYAFERGAVCYILDAQNEISLLCSGEQIELPFSNIYPYFSLIPLDKSISGLTILGAKYSITDMTVVRSHMYTVSNEVLEDVAHIYLRSGRAFIIRSRD